MNNNSKIIQAISEYFDLHPNKEHITPVEANEYLEKIGVLKDSNSRKGKPLRELLREGLIPNAQKFGYYWRIYRPNHGDCQDNQNIIKKSCQPVIKKEPTNLPNFTKCFEPIVDEESRFLILGTMPGTDSLKTGEYYASSRNSFWKIMSALYNESKPFSSHEEKIECLHKNHIALWDVYKSCEREGALDKDIRNAVPNDINGFLKEYPSIETVIANGQKASENLKLNRDFICAGSTSNTNSKPIEYKIEEWKDILSK